MLLGIAAAVLAAVGFVLWGGSGQPRSAGHGPAPTSRATTSKHRGRAHSTPPQVDRGATSQEQKAPAAIHVTLTAARDDSWVEVRRESSTGRVLFDGIVQKGKSIRVAGHRFWARFGALGNFDLTVNGRPVHPAFNGTVDTLITASAIRLAPTQSQSG